MYKKKKERLYLSDLLDNPSVTYPSYYALSSSMMKNEMLHYAITVLHSLDFKQHQYATTYEDIFAMFEGGMFPIYKEMYVVGYFGGKMMYLDANGWKGMPCTQDVFKIENWMVC
jgi:hypothetical protein